MAERKHRVLIVSERLLVAQGIVSLLGAAPEIADVEVIGNLYDVLTYSRSNLPDVLVIDVPAGAKFYIDRPIAVDGCEIKTIVLLEGDKNNKARLYVHLPGMAANLPNLMSAILVEADGNAQETPNVEALMDAPAVLPAIPQPTSLMRARASGPSKSRISSSSAEL